MKHVRSWSILCTVLAAFISVFSAPATQAASVNNFHITDYTISYELSRDAEKRSLLRTTETITVDFPQQNQNHGIERAIPRSYNDHSVDLNIVSVTDEGGVALEYETYRSNDNEVVRIGSADDYVQGRHTYVLVYTQRDVTRFFENTGNNEFYWNTNGLEWRVPINRLSITLAISDELRSSLREDIACYRGARGESNTCDITQSADKSQFTISADQLRPAENVTLAIGFNEDTFAAYQPSLFERLLPVLIAVYVAITLIGISVGTWLIVRFVQWNNRTKELGTIVPEYLPPKKTSVTTSATIVSGTSTSFAAQLIDFAVRHYIKIYETKPKSTWSQAEYTIEIIKDTSSLLPEEREILKDIFPTTKVGSRLALKSLQNNTKIYNNTLDNDTKLRALVRGSYGLRQLDKEKKSVYNRWAIGFLVAGIVSVNPVLLLLSAVLFALTFSLWPLTDKGLALRRYLLGLKEYITVAEVDRLNMLQSPEGAEKVGSIDTDNASQMIKLYERVLPYAVLFGQEKQWNIQLGRYYESLQSSPDWMAGSSGAFQAAALSSAISSFTTSASYSSPTSSSSGGSSGGGFSGGGGGGGGGGGW